jgi:cytochrome c oxidase subunit 3
MAVGAITWMHQSFHGAVYVLLAGTLGVLFTMAGWWRDVIREAERGGYHTRVVQISHRYGMILFIASEVMFFVAWFWAYFDVALFPTDVHQVVRDLAGAVPADEHVGHRFSIKQGLISTNGSLSASIVRPLADVDPAFLTPGSGGYP